MMKMVDEATQKIGLLAYLGTDAFDKAMHFYMAAIDAINAKNDNAARNMSQKMGGAANTASTAFGGLTAKAVAMGNIMATVVMGAITKVVGGLKQIASNSLNAAARVQELSYVSQIMANNAGIAQE
jgi:hypothetical protein